MLNLESGLVYFEDGTFTRGPMRLPSAEARETVSFEFGIVAPGGRELTRVALTASFHADAAMPVSATVSTEEWIGPARVQTQEKDLLCECNKVVERLRLGSTKPDATTVDDIFFGEWRSFNRVATRTDDINASFVFECEVQRQHGIHQELATADSSAIEGRRHCTTRAFLLPGDISVGFETSKTSRHNDGTIKIFAGWTHEKGIAKFVEREYSILSYYPEGEGRGGELMHIRECSKVRGRWVGGEM